MADIFHSNTLSSFLSTSNATPEVPADHYPELRQVIGKYMNKAAIKEVEAAYQLAAEYHKDQTRRSGEPYINHPVEVALILARELKGDKDVVTAALLHDVIEDTAATQDEVQKLFGSTVSMLVDGVTKLTNIDVANMDEQQALNLRKMFLAMNKDIRVVLIKLADRLHNMRTLAALPHDRQIFKAQETMQVYAPIADRLGISSIKWELEDLAFSYLDPENFRRISGLVQESRNQRLKRTRTAIGELSRALKKAHVRRFSITGRPKHLWSIYQKMHSKDKDFSDIYDLIALRVICESVKDCYSILGAVHQLWHPLPGRFKDYIATPKPNLYQSIHTTVVGPDGRPLEIQIRTRQMHEQAEYGIAAHWLYKSSGNSEGVMANDEKSVDSRISYIRRSLEWAAQSGVEDPERYLKELSFDLYESEIFLFTPKGEVVSLRKDSTPLDFAYAIHTDIGNTCVGAKVNGSVVPLTYKLQMGDRIEIMTNKSAHPSPDWINIVKTPGARSKIRRYFAHVNKDSDMERGRALLATELRKEGYGIATRRSTRAIAQLAEQMELKDSDALMVGIGNNQLSAAHIAHQIAAILDEGRSSELKKEAQKAAQERKQRLIAEDKPFMVLHAPHQAETKKAHKNAGLVVNNDPTLLAQPAQCCNPVPGDDIVGYITRGRGVSVHRKACPNVSNLFKEHPERRIAVSWDVSGATEFSIEIVVEAIDRMGLLRDVTDALQELSVNILSISTQLEDGVVKLRFLISLFDVSLLDDVLARISKVPSVFDARRIKPGEPDNVEAEVQDET